MMNWAKVSSLSSLSKILWQALKSQNVCHSSAMLSRELEILLIFEGGRAESGKDGGTLKKDYLAECFMVWI